jgi:hypothetical protein
MMGEMERKTENQRRRILFTPGGGKVYKLGRIRRFFPSRWIQAVASEAAAAGES